MHVWDYLIHCCLLAFYRALECIWVKTPNHPRSLLFRDSSFGRVYQMLDILMVCKLYAERRERERELAGTYDGCPLLHRFIPPMNQSLHETQYSLRGRIESNAFLLGVRR